MDTRCPSVPCGSAKIQSLSKNPQKKKRATYFQVNNQQLPHVKLFIAVRKVTTEARLGMVVKMGAQRVHAGKKLTAELARLVPPTVRLGVLLQIS